MAKKKIKAITAQEYLKEQTGNQFVTRGADWYGRELETKSNPVIDPGIGKPIILRKFEFKANPEFKGKPTKQDVFNHHWKQIETILWSDGLVPRKDIAPRVEVKGTTYYIFILAEARLNTLVIEKPMRLDQLIPNGHKKS